MKDPPSFSRLVDLRPVEPSRGPSLVKVNTNSRQCVSRSYPYFPPSLAQSIFVYSFSLSLSIPPVHKSTPPSFFISKLRLSSSLYPSPLSPHLDTIVLSSPLLSSPLHRPCFFSLPRLPTERRIIPSSLIPYASNSYGTFDSSLSSTFLPPSLDIVSVAVKLTRDQ